MVIMVPAPKMKIKNRVEINFLFILYFTLQFIESYLKNFKVRIKIFQMKIKKKYKIDSKFKMNELKKIIIFSNFYYIFV